MAISDITIWLNSSRDYTTGLALVEKYNPSYAMIVFLKSGKSSLTMRYMTDELQRINDAASASLTFEQNSDLPKQNVIIYRPTSSSSQAPTLQPSLLPKPLQKRAEQKNRLYREAAELRRRLKPLSAAERVPMIERIKNCFFEIDQIWKEIDFYTQNGEILTAEDKLLNKADLMKKILNSRSNVSRYKGRPDKAALLSKHIAELTRLEALYESF